MKLYLAGPMTGIPFFNFPEFHTAAHILRKRGHEVFNPAEADIKRMGFDISEKVPDGDPKKAAEFGFDLRQALFEDLEFILKHADGIAMLPGWEYSSGANLEHQVAKTLRLKFMYFSPDWMRGYGV